MNKKKKNSRLLNSGDVTPPHDEASLWLVNNLHVTLVFTRWWFGCLWLADSHHAISRMTADTNDTVSLKVEYYYLLSWILFFSFYSPLVAMHCLTCKRRSSSSGQSILQMYKKVTPNFLNVFVRAVVLFIVGGFLALVLTVLSMLPESRRRNLGVLPHEVIVNVFSDTWWIPPSCGTAAVVIGLIYPMSDSRIGEPHKIQRDWSSVARCVAIFVGINHACAVSLCYSRKRNVFFRFQKNIYSTIFS